MENIVLIGMMGCGKTTISKLLGKKLNKLVIDTDEYIVNKYHQTIDEMFVIGEDYFRENETNVCKEIVKLNGYIISTGGGIVLDPLNIKYLKENGIVVFIDRPLNNIKKDVDISSRPLLKEGSDKLDKLYNQRYQLYLEACDIHLVNDDSLEVVTDHLVELLKNKI